jgi:hypothetical protein
MRFTGVGEPFGLAIGTCWKVNLSINKVLSDRVLERRRNDRIGTYLKSRKG